MNIALVNSGTEPCPNCGCREPILVGAVGSPIETTISDTIDAQWRTLELELTALHGEVLAAERRDRMEHEALMRQAATATKRSMEAAHADYEQRVADVLGERVKWYRPFRRRVVRQMRDAVNEAVDELREQTRRA